MSARVHNLEYAAKRNKDIWHPYTLQSLNQSRFIRVVGKILKGEYDLLDTKVNQAKRAEMTIS